MWTELADRLVYLALAPFAFDPLALCLAALGGSVILLFSGVCLWCEASRLWRYNESLRCRLEAMIAEFDNPILTAGFQNCPDEACGL